MTGDSLEEAGSQVYVVVDGFFSFRGKPRPQDLLPNFSSGVLRSSIINGTACHSSQFLGLYLIKFLKEISNMSFEQITTTISTLIDINFPFQKTK